MKNHILPKIVAAFAGTGMLSLSAEIPETIGDVESSHVILESPVLKVFTAKAEGYRFIAYLVKWEGAEVIVSDPLARSDFHVGDKVQFMVHKMALPGSGKAISSLGFMLMEDGSEDTKRDAEMVSPEEKERQSKLVGGDLGAAKDEIERFYGLNRAAKNAFGKGDKEKAKELATELEGLAPKHPDDWNYGNAIQDSNQVLGLIALADGDLDEAKKRLLASADCKGSPQMNSFGPNMKLAKALLEKGERETVIEYFDRCAKFWEMGEAKLKSWKAQVGKGEMPDFGGNLLY